MITKRIKSYRFTVTLFLALVMTLGFAVDNTRVLAAYDVQFYSGNDVLFYNPDAGKCAAADDNADLRGGSTKEQIWNYLIDKGLTPEQAAGIMGNMEEESRLSPVARQGTGNLWDSEYYKAWGLVQWDGVRRYTAPKGGILGKLRDKHPELVKYTEIEYDSKDDKVPPKDLEALVLFELEYMFNELENRTERGGSAKEIDALKKLKTAEEVVRFWNYSYERSSDTESGIQERVDAGHAIMKEFAGNDSESGATDGGACESAVTGDLAATTLAYAWPDYHEKGYVKRMPDYITAVEKAKDEGKYTGDPCHGGGVDCGAFVTLLLNNSGFDTSYNHNGKGGYTAIQKAWAEKNWQNLGNGSSINTADLKPGDVAHLDGHTFIFVGKDIPGFGEGDNAFKGVASASQCGRAPMAGHESMTDSGITWYRKK